MLLSLLLPNSSASFGIFPRRWQLALTSNVFEEKRGNGYEPASPCLWERCFIPFPTSLTIVLLYHTPQLRVEQSCWRLVLCEVLSSPFLSQSFVSLFVWRKNDSRNNETSFQLAFQLEEDSIGFCPRIASSSYDQTGSLDKEMPILWIFHS